VKEPKQEAPQFEKEVVRLPDGRELTYYRFPEGHSQAAGKPRTPAPQGQKEP